MSLMRRPGIMKSLGGAIDLKKKIAVGSDGFEGKNFGRRAPSKPF